MKKFLQPVKILTIIFVTLLCIAVVGNQVAGAYANVINRALNIKTDRVVNTGEVDPADTVYFESEYSENTYDEDGNAIYTQESIDRLRQDAEELVIELEGEGLVLMKNDNSALPLASGAKISLFGQGSAMFNYASSGSSAAITSGYADLKTAMEEAGFTVNQTLWDFYTSGQGSEYRRSVGANGYLTNEAPWSLVESNSSSSFSEYGDAAIVVISRNSGEGRDITTSGSDGLDGSYLSLTQNEVDMLTALTELKNNGTFDSIIVILNTANPVQLDFLNNSNIGVDALMWVGNVGKTGIYAVARAIAGTIVPSGRLSDTYVYDNFSSPAMASWGANPDRRFAQQYTNASNYDLNGTQYNYGVYVEGIYVGYRYYETRYEDVVLGTQNVGAYDYEGTVAYPFGYGLSYATFEYSNYTVTENSDSFEISLTVTNTSDAYDGKEVVQVYIQKPYAGEGAPEVSSVELAGYAKTGVIPHGQSETVNISVSKEQFTSYDVNANNGRGGYVVESGTHYIAAGKDSHDALNNILRAKVENGATVAEAEMTSSGDASFVYSWTQASRDEITYAASRENSSNLVTNQLDFADINRYENRGDNSVTYVSRSDWDGTFPDGSIKLSLTDMMAADLAVHKALPTETDEDVPTYGADSNMSLIMMRSTEENVIDYDSSAWDTFLDQMTYEQQSLLLTNAAFGTVAFGAYPSPDNPINNINKPATTDNDGATGVVGSVTGTSFPSEGIWASTFNVDLIRRVGEIFAEDALANDVQSLYATGINIHRTPFGGRAHEYFSEDPYLTGMSVVYEVAGMQSKGVIPTLKHFVFNDQEDQRGGICTWLNEQTAREIYLKPFEMAMRPSIGNAHAIMTSFNRAGCIWTSASSELMINIVRNEWNFDGYSITDMADSFAYYMTYDDGIMNGTDLYLGAGNEYALSDYAYSIPFRLRVREACHRVLYVIANYSAAMNGFSASSMVIQITPWWQVALYSVIGVSAGVTAVGAMLWILAYVLPESKKVKKEKANE